jgi:hypothetical protein
VKKIQTVRHPELETVSATFSDAPVLGVRLPVECRLFESAMGGHLWLGMRGEDADLMCIDEDLAEQLWPLLKTFAETGRLPEPTEPPL